MSGTTDKAKGRVKEAIGALTDDQRLKNEGKVDQASRSRCESPLSAHKPDRLADNGVPDRPPSRTDRRNVVNLQFQPGRAMARNPSIVLP